MKGILLMSVQEPTIHLVEYYARNCTWTEFSDLLTRRGVPDEDRRPLMDRFHDLRKKPENREDEEWT